ELVGYVAKNYGPESKQTSNRSEKNYQLPRNGNVRVLECLRQKEIHSKNNRLTKPYRQDWPNLRSYPSPAYPRLIELIAPDRFDEELCRKNRREQEYSCDKVPRRTCQER